MGEQPSFATIAGGFAANIQSLRVFAERIGRHADEHDREAAAGLEDALRAVFPGASDVRIEFGPSSESRTDDSTNSVTDVKDETKIDGSVADNVPDTDKQEWTKDPHLVREILKAMRSFTKAGPQQGALLRRSALITLMSYLEALVSDLVHAYYARYPSALPAEQRSLTLAELRELGSVGDAVQLLVSQEVDSLLRESLEGQVAYFRKPLKVDTTPIDGVLARLIEIDQRRNIYVHNRGRVNHHYLKRVEPYLASEFGAKDGEPLPVSEEYLSASIDHVYAGGLMLIMQSWVKWASGEDEDRELFLVNTTFEEVQEGRNDLVRRLAAYATEQVVENDERCRIIVVNHAIALKQSGEDAAMAALLAGLDWSATSLRFRLALCSLRSEQAEFFRLLPKALAADEVKRGELMEWPVFAPARSFPDFDAALNRLAPPVIDESPSKLPPLTEPSSGN